MPDNESASHPTSSARAPLSIRSGACVRIRPKFLRHLDSVARVASRRTWNRGAGAFVVVRGAQHGFVRAQGGCVQLLHLHRRIARTVHSDDPLQAGGGSCTHTTHASPVDGSRRLAIHRVSSSREPLGRAGHRWAVRLPSHDQRRPTTQPSIPPDRVWLRGFFVAINGQLLPSAVAGGRRQAAPVQGMDTGLESAIRLCLSAISYI